MICIKSQGSSVAELRLRGRHLPPSPACSPRLGGGHHRPESPRPTDETKAPPEAWKLPFGMWLLQETSMLPLFLVMLCYHRQSSWTESLTRIKGARKADLLWRLWGPAAHKARLPGARWETWLWERKQPMDGLLGLPGCLWSRAETQLTFLMCCEGVSSSKTQVSPGLAWEKTWLYQHISMTLLLFFLCLRDQWKLRLCHCIWLSVRATDAFPGGRLWVSGSPQHHGSRTTLNGKQGFAFCSFPHPPPGSQHAYTHLQGLTTSTAERRWGKIKNVWLLIYTFMYILERVYLYILHIAYI